MTTRERPTTDTTALEARTLYRCNRCHAPMKAVPCGADKGRGSGACECGGLIETHPQNLEVLAWEEGAYYRRMWSEHRVEAQSVADFLAKFYKPDRYRPGAPGFEGEQAAEALASREADIKRLGVTWISHHDSRCISRGSAPIALGGSLDCSHDLERIQVGRR